MSEGINLNKVKEIVKNVNLKASIFIIIFLSVGIICICISYTELFLTNILVQLILREIGGLFLVSSSVSLVWELFAKRKLLDEIIAKTNLNRDIMDTGIFKITDSFLKISNDEWKSFFKSAKEIDFFFCYARSWRRNRRDDFNEIKKKGNIQIRVILPDPNHSDTINELARRFNYSSQDLKNMIEEAINYFKGLKENSNIKLQLQLLKEAPLYSIYRFDDIIIFAIFTHRGNESVPTFICEKEGTLYNYFFNEFEQILNKTVDILNES